MKILLTLILAVFTVGFFSIVVLRDHESSDRSISTGVSAEANEFTLLEDVDLLSGTETPFEPPQSPDEFHAIQSDVQTDVRINLVSEESQFLDADLAIWESHEDDEGALNIGDDLDADGWGYVPGNLTEVVEIGEFIDVEAATP